MYKQTNICFSCAKKYSYELLFKTRNSRCTFLDIRLPMYQISDPLMQIDSTVDRLIEIDKIDFTNLLGM